MQQMNTISDVLTRLASIVAECKRAQSALGYFPALYYQMTAAVQRGIADGQFQDGRRMEQLDIVFAQRYIDAYAAWRQGKPTTRAWRAAFEAAQADDLSVLQHLLLGIHAHINLDLGIAAAQVSAGKAIGGLQADFDRINAIIAHLTEQVQDRLADVCPPLRVLDDVLHTQDEGIADFSIVVARKTAWNVARSLSCLQGPSHAAFIEGVDEGVAAFSQRLRMPKGWVLRSALSVLKMSEQGTVSTRIEVLGSV